MFNCISVCLPIANVEKTMYRKAFKKYAQKWRLGNVSLWRHKENF